MSSVILVGLSTSPWSFNSQDANSCSTLAWPFESSDHCWKLPIQATLQSLRPKRDEDRVRILLSGQNYFTSSHKSRHSMTKKLTSCNCAAQCVLWANVCSNFDDSPVSPCIVLTSRSEPSKSHEYEALLSARSNSITVWEKMLYEATLFPLEIQALLLWTFSAFQ